MERRAFLGASAAALAGLAVTSTAVAEPMVDNTEPMSQLYGLWVTEDLKQVQDDKRIYPYFALLPGNMGIYPADPRDGSQISFK